MNNQQKHSLSLGQIYKHCLCLRIEVFILITFLYRDKNCSASYAAYKRLQITANSVKLHDSALLRGKVLFLRVTACHASGGTKTSVTL